MHTLQDPLQHNKEEQLITPEVVWTKSSFTDTGVCLGWEPCRTWTLPSDDPENAQPKTADAAEAKYGSQMRTVLFECLRPFQWEQQRSSVDDILSVTAVPIVFPAQPPREDGLERAGFLIYHK